MKDNKENKKNFLKKAYENPVITKSEFKRFFMICGANSNSCPGGPAKTGGSPWNCT